MNEGKKLPLTVGSDIVGTAIVRSDGKIDITFDANLCKSLGLYDKLVAKTLDNISIDIGEPIPETKEE